MKQEKIVSLLMGVLFVLILVQIIATGYTAFHANQVLTTLSSQPYAFNLTACTTNPIPQYCGIPNGQVCAIENNNSTNVTAIICLDYWLSPNGKQVILSNTQNVQTVLSNLP